MMKKKGRYKLWSGMTRKHLHQDGIHVIFGMNFFRDDDEKDAF